MSHRPRSAQLQRAAAAQAPLNMEATADLKRQRNTAKVHALGPRVFDELLAEIGAEFSIMTPIEQKLARYARLDPGDIAALGVDQFPPRTLTVIRGGREIEAGVTKGNGVTEDNLGGEE